ncbi:hypothetical protein DPMN_010684 [Dreissena polymorpha]|uniref:Uncharacterized protein n=1 Tax=Dreissena polymorpha TaxID=45954 RepID=A0A9D4MZ66_DREPO|nr:hypothetical protein DPMN_010684 [Dreissena polymorpha]
MNLLTKKNALPLGSHFFQANKISFELIQYFIETNLLTKFHEDWTINVASRVLTRKNARPWWPYVIVTNLLTKFHDDRKINVTSRPCPGGGHVFQPTGIIFELAQDIIGMNCLTEFHDNQTITVASRVLTRFYYSHIRKNAPPLGSKVFQANVTIFELINFHEDWTIYVASRELTRQMLTPHNPQRTKSDHKSSS